MKWLIVVAVMLSTGCSAVITNQGGPIAADPCRWIGVPFADAIVAGTLGSMVAGGTIDSGTKQDQEAANMFIVVAGSIFLVSAVMGYGEMSECTKIHKR